MDGPFWVDTRAPHMSADTVNSPITVIGTNKRLVPLDNLPILGANYWSYAGKACRIRIFGRSTGAASAGTYTFTYLWGTGADANGTAIVSSPAITLVNSHTNLSWMSEVVIRCRSIGATGTLFGTGFMLWNVGAVLSTNAPIMIPASAPAASASLDLTASNVISPQVLAATSTTNTITVHDFLFESLN
jgi:hypothetical protein